MISIMSDWRNIFDGRPQRRLEQGRFLFRREERVRFLFLVRSGAIALERPTKDGIALTLQVAQAGEAIAEASLFSTTYHCDAVARTRAIVAIVPREDFLAALHDQPARAVSLVESHARVIQAQRSRIEILRLRRVSERLDAWLDLNGEPGVGQWATIADKIGVSPAALYRELARRRS
jgi:CRP/FNR family transcriptional regulator, dissimilatory nitrate respiration regulator